MIMQARLRINADYITPSCSIFLTCRGEKYIQYNTITYRDSIYIWNPLNATAKIPYLEWLSSVHDVGR
jgi:hypothetical protein